MTPLPTGTVYLNGRMLPAARARVSVFDRGWLYGDGLFETLRVYRGRAFGLALHLERMEATARWMKLALPPLDWRAVIDRLLDRNQLSDADASVRLSVTRGAGLPGLVPPAGLAPTVLVTCATIPARIARDQRRGITAVLFPFTRNGEITRHKVTAYLPAVLGRLHAHERGALEAFYLDRRGRVSEGTTSNLFVCDDAGVRTPPVATGCLPGVTRRLVIELARVEGVQVREQRLVSADLLTAREVFCTGSVAEVMPIIRVDGQRIGTGVGLITRRLQRRYRALVAQNDL